MGSITLCLLALCILFIQTNGLLRSRDLPNEMAKCLNKFYKSCTIEDEVGLSILHNCIQEYKWKPNPERQYPVKRLSPGAIAYGERLARRVQSLGSRRGKRQAVRRRKEYRMLTDDERNRYHNAVRRLKESRNGESQYDMIASIHTGDIEQTAHFGCHFAGFHREYLKMYEEALREIDPSVTLPYWDSTIEQYMDSSAESLLFTAEFMGNGNGEVTSGPAANWQTETGPLRRNIGVEGELYLFEEIQNITNQTRFTDICGLTRDVESNGLEFHHGDIHLWVGGNMAELNTAADDPLFWMHHANVDRIWELQRSFARRAGVDVDNDYPTDPNDFGNEFHAPDAEFGLFRTDLRVRDGVSGQLINGIYQYEQPPTCSANRMDCGSNQLRCAQLNGRYLCISKTLEEYRRDLEEERTRPGGNNRGFPRQPTNPWFNRRWFGGNTRNPSRPMPRVNPGEPEAITYPLIDQCSAFEYKPIQNSFCANGRKDVKEWVYLPVRVISQRDPSFTKYDSYPVRSGNIRSGSDIYSLNSYTKLKSALNPGSPQCYQKCRSSQTGAGEVFVRTDGISYTGTYQEYAIVDQRLPVSVSVAYVAVKSPVRGKTSAVISAYDSCGRVCRPSCLNLRSKKYEPCSGAIDVTTKAPHLYAYSLGDSIMKLYGLNGAPQFNDNEIFLSFFCDYSNKW
ncbi:putative tyrosinase-like protein tyr-3 [Saccostrea cucullata]|uniref:putative tyrosinase-like protein tyr-3 n=1 Tax=Saccostrea cuccullata TaxID=36930 RepID=UPI002ED24D8A